MQDDLTDAVKWAIGEGIADPDRVGIFGGSYGGYAALAGAAFTPDFYRCAVDLVGPSNLFTHIRAHGSYWNVRSIWNARTGNPDDPADHDLLTNASPLFSADKIRIPILIAQGANDPIVKQAESEQIVAAIERTAVPQRTCFIPTKATASFRRPTGWTSWRVWRDFSRSISADGMSRCKAIGSRARRRS